jgi:hypothetical protein
VRVIIMSATRLETDVLMAESTFVTVLAGLRPALTSLSYLPQVKKAWPRDSKLGQAGVLK